MNDAIKNLLAAAKDLLELCRFEHIIARDASIKTYVLIAAAEAFMEPVEPYIGIDGFPDRCRECEAEVKRGNNLCSNCGKPLRWPA